MTARTTIGRYRITGLLGEGGMGVVYAAHDERLDRAVAIKTLRTAGDPEGRARLWREARAAASVSHPHVCPIYEVGEEGDELFLAMELLQGESLAQRLERGPLPLPEAITGMIAVLDALQALHHRQVVHRDLKPSNVFLTAHGLRLLDFGLARPVQSENDVTLTQAGMIVGTPRYMAPEQWRGEPGDSRTDLFASGALLFEMLTARPAFGGTTPIEVYHAVLHEHPPALTGSDAVMAVDRVVHRALEKQPSDRWESAQDMAAALRAVLARPDASGARGVHAMTRVIVLPFRMLRPDPEVEFLAFSLPDAVTSSLSGLQSVIVRSSHAAAKFAGDTLDLKRIAAEAEVDAVLVGTLIRAGDQVRVSTQLIEAPAGTVKWSKTVQAPIQDLFQVQDELAHAILESLAVPLTAQDKRQLDVAAPGSGRAYELYLRANQIGRDLSKLMSAKDLYRAALEEDSGYAPAWARYARVCRVLAKYGHGSEAATHLHEAERAFARAFQLNPDLPVAHSLYTHFELENGAVRAAIARLLDQARVRPSDPELFTGLCAACRYGGLLDASLAAHRRARRLDPEIQTSVAYTYLMRGDYHDAIAVDAEAIYVTPYALPLVGKHDEARQRYKVRMADPINSVSRVLAEFMLAAIDRDVEAVRASAARFRASAFADPEGYFFLARALAYVNERDESLEIIARCIDGGWTCPSPLLIDPWLDSLRGDPRFAELIERAEEGKRAAQAVFSEHGGEKLLGME